MEEALKSDNCLNQHFSEEHREVLHQTAMLSQSLTNLCYEGKASFGKNMKLLKSSFKFFNGPFKKHVTLEEEVIYPFFERHVPKFSAVITLLRSEHQEIQKRLRQLHATYKKFSNDPKDRYNEELKERIDGEGNHFVHLVEMHLKSESENIFKLVIQYLNQEEISLLCEQIYEAKNTKV